MVTKYRLRYFFEWGGGPCLWADNDAAIDQFDVGGVDYTDLPLSPQTITLAEQLAQWHDKSLNWDYPPDPGPWRQPECDRFNDASKQLLQTIREDLGDEYDIVDRQPVLREDPELDRYLQDPKGFRRS